jgi:ParB-like chromosome segregation protein Spo0J
MEYVVQKIAASSIKFKDKTFIISTATNSDLLQRSIERVGLLNPPYLYFDSAKKYYQIVCGYRRIQACVACGWQEISACVIASGSSQGELFLLGLYDNLAHRVLNPIEQAHAAAKLLSYFTEETVIRDYLPLMGLHPTCKTLEHLRCLAALEPAMQDAVVNGTIPETVAITLADRGAADKKAFMELLSQVHLSVSKQEEILAHCNDIALRDGVSYREILYDAAMHRILEQEKLSRSQKGDQVRARLRKIRFPRLAHREEIFIQQRKKLHLPSGVQLMPPPFFEGQTFRLQIEFDDREVLADKAAHVMDLVKNNDFSDLLEDR